MSLYQHKTLGDTVYFWFGANDTDGSGNDGATPVYDVRLAGAPASAAPVLSGSAVLLSHASYPAGCHELAIQATAGNGFAAGNTYGVFCTLLVDSQNPTGFVGAFTLASIPAIVTDKKGFGLTAAERNSVADAVLQRNVSNVEAAAPEHSLCTVVLAMLESSMSGTTWTIHRADGSTTHATKTLTTSPSADRITGVS